MKTSLEDQVIAAIRDNTIAVAIKQILEIISQAEKQARRNELEALYFDVDSDEISTTLGNQTVTERLEELKK
jgi:hypothetical protein